MSLEARAVTKRFGASVVALDDVSLAVEHGEFVSIVGPSGCGKSTLLRLVAGLSPCTAGEIVVRGERVREPRADVGMMFQSPTLLPWRTALENTLMPERLRRGVSAEARNRARDLLRLVGIAGFENAYPAHLSGGMQQRVALARLLMTGADLMLLDEPFGALDEFTRERLNLELLRLHAEIGSTIMFVTHNIAEAVFLADRVVVMTPHPGRLARILEVPLPRPRDIDVQRTREFSELVFAVREVLDLRQGSDV